MMVSSAPEAVSWRSLLWALGSTALPLTTVASRSSTGRNALPPKDVTVGELVVPAADRGQPGGRLGSDVAAAEPWRRPAPRGHRCGRRPVRPLFRQRVDIAWSTESGAVPRAALEQQAAALGQRLDRSLEVMIRID